MKNPFRAATERMQRRADDGASPYYAGAAYNRLFYDFVMGSLSANTALRGSLRTLRNRARELTTRNSHASRIPQIFSENVIGENGVTYTAAVKTGEGEFDEKVNAELERAWYTWCQPKNCSVDRSLSWPEIETLLMESEVVDGEVLIRLVRDFDNPFGFALDILDPDQLDHSIDRPASAGVNAIVMGIEVDKWGAPLYYHLYSNHPSENGGRGTVKVPAADILHRFIRRRARQARGVTWLAPAVVDMSMHGGWREAHLIASRTASAKMGFFEHGEDADVGDDDSDEDTLPLEASAGIIERLPKGVKFTAWDPTFPSTNFAEFDQSILHSIATGARVSYMSLSGDLTKTSYGSGRIGLLAEQAVYKWLARRHIDRTSIPVLEAWLPQALLYGGLRLPASQRERYRAATWHPKPQPWLAPQEDLNVRLAKRRACLTSLFDIAAEEGNDLEDQFRKIQREEQLAVRYGVTIDLSPTSNAAQPLVGADAPAPVQPGRPGAASAAPIRLYGGT